MVPGNLCASAGLFLAADDKKSPSSKRWIHISFFLGFFFGKPIIGLLNWLSDSSASHSNRWKQNHYSQHPPRIGYPDLD